MLAVNCNFCLENLQAIKALQKLLLPINIKAKLNHESVVIEFKGDGSVVIEF